MKKEYTKEELKELSEDKRLTLERLCLRYYCALSFPKKTLERALQKALIASMTAMNAAKKEEQATKSVLLWETVKTQFYCLREILIGALLASRAPLDERQAPLRYPPLVKCAADLRFLQSYPTRNAFIRAIRALQAQKTSVSHKKRCKHERKRH